jgi:membrane-bound metal-dependent hydrolase YbcI (DUF457 family)
MPITPFHFGPGAALHSAAPRQISFLAFCAANVLVDVEPLYFMLTAQYPLHRFFHTFIGVSLVVAGTTTLFLAALKLAGSVRLPKLFGWQQLTRRQVIIGAALGGYSHILLDSLMHGDMQPFAPFSASNPLLHAVPLGLLHWFCLGAGVVGVGVLAVRKLLQPSPGRPQPGTWAEAPPATHGSVAPPTPHPPSS